VKPFFIVAGNAEQARIWSKHNFKPDTKYVYVYGPEALKGYNNPKGIFTGDWHKRTDIKEIVKILVDNTDRGNISQELSTIYCALTFNIDPTTLSYVKSKTYPSEVNNDAASEG
jgi:hypothetical protein